MPAGDGSVTPSQHQPPAARRPGDPLAGLRTRFETVAGAPDRISALLGAVVAVGRNLELEIVLRQVVEAAVELVDAPYGALGVVSDKGELTEFVPVGMDDEQIAAIHHWPKGHGLLGELIRDPQPLRLADMAAHPRSAGFPAGHPPMKTFIGVPIRVRDAVFGNLYLTEKRGGGEFDAEDVAVLTALAAAAGVAVENARLYDEARRQQRWLRASAETAQRLLSGAEPAEVLALVTELALEVAGADLVVLALPAGDGKRLIIEHAAGKGAESALGLALPVSRSASGTVLATGKPMRLADFRTDGRAARVAREHLRLGPAVVLPLGPPGNVKGILTVGRAPGAPPLPPRAVDVLMAFAAQAGVGLQLAEHRRAAEQIAVFEDRDRIARDLHDLVIQRLYATGMALEMVSARLGDGENGRRVAAAVDALDDTIMELRSAIFSLHSRPGDDAAPLRGRLLAVADEAAPVLGFAPTLRLAGPLDSRVPPLIAEHVLGVLREALSNAARHAGATRVHVTGEAGADELTLVVTDNGRGLPAGGRRSGLANLADRAELLGGRFTAGPADGGGTRLDWQVPLGG